MTFISEKLYRQVFLNLRAMLLLPKKRGKIQSEMHGNPKEALLDEPRNHQEQQQCRVKILC